MLSLFVNNQADVLEAFNSTSSYQDDLLNIDNLYSGQMVDQIQVKIISKSSPQEPESL